MTMLVANEVHPVQGGMDFVYVVYRPSGSVVTITSLVKTTIDPLETTDVVTGN